MPTFKDKMIVMVTNPLFLVFVAALVVSLVMYVKGDVTGTTFLTVFAGLVGAFKVAMGLLGSGSASNEAITLARVRLQRNLKPAIPPRVDTLNDSDIIGKGR